MFLSCLVGVTLSGWVSVLYSVATPFDVPTVVSILRMEGWEIREYLVTKGEEVALVEGDVVLDYLYEEALSNWVCRPTGLTNCIRMWGEDNTLRYASDFSSYVSALNLSNLYVLRETTHAALIEQLTTLGCMVIMPFYLEMWI